jgi:DNA polymerase elongation subunit (family B)
LYVKDFKKNGIALFNNDKQLKKSMRIMHGIEFKKLETGGQKRLKDGYCYLVTSSKSYNSIINYFKEGGIYPYQKAEDEQGNILKNKKGDPIYLYRDLFFSPKLYEQFFIDKKARLFKGFEEYKDVHRVTVDIETTGLRPEISRMFAIGIRDNRGIEEVLEVNKKNDDDAEAELIQDFFNTISILEPAIIVGHNLEEFDFYYILERARILGVDLYKLTTSLREDIKIKRRPNCSVKIGGDTEKYTATEMWGISIIDTLFAARRTAAINSDIKETNLKYIAKFEDIARENRTYIPGEDGAIGRYYHENPYFIANDKNEHIEVPSRFQETVSKLEELKKTKYLPEQKKEILDNDPDFVKWFREEAIPKGMKHFVEGEELVKNYLLDDLWETEQIDELYNQSSFMLAKIVPTIYSKICTMGTASVWNLLLTAWSYERDLAIPHADVYKHFSGGLSRCYKRGYTKRLIKIDYASLYPMLQLTHDIFPIFDISGVMKKMLIYMTTTRNIYKKLGKGTKLNEEEVSLMNGMDHESYVKYISNSLSSKERSMFDVKQKPIKILNNSQFGALGANVAFNWSDNNCAARITASGRIELRHAIHWFAKFGCTPLYAVTDGVNFEVPNKTTIKLTNEGIIEGETKGTIEEMWKFDNEFGINALIEYFNETQMKKPFMAVDNDGEFISCYNLARINYAVLQEYKDKKTGELKTKVKYTGNSIKSAVMPEYVEDFYDRGFRMLLEGRGSDFVEYYYDYAQKIFYKQIPLKKIASKSRYKNTIKQYLNRGTDKNGRQKAKQAFMELVIRERERIAEELFEKHKENLEFKKSEEEMTVQEKMKLVELYMPPEPELDSTLYYYNTGYRKSHGDSQEIKDKESGELRFASTLISKEEMLENPDMTGDYNIDKYLDSFNKKVKAMLYAFDPEIAQKIPAKIVRKKVKDVDGNKVEEEKLEINYFTKDQLKLSNFDLDDVEESMYLEEHEVNFWNETGFDPRLVWDGFKLRDDMKVHYEIYENALIFVNEKMKSVGKPPVKSINDEHERGDYILIKDGSKYHLGHHTGVFVKIVKENIEVPKSDIEKELDNKLKQEEEKLKKLEINESKSLKEIEFENKIMRRKKYYTQFAERFNIVSEYSEYVDAFGDEGLEMLDAFIKQTEEEEKEEVQNYMGGDYE